MACSVHSIALNCGAQDKPFSLISSTSFKVIEKLMSSTKMAVKRSDSRAHQTYAPMCMNFLQCIELIDWSFFPILLLPHFSLTADAYFSQLLIKFETFGRFVYRNSSFPSIFDYL